MFDQYSEETLDRTKQRAMDHHWPVRFVILADELQLKTVRHIKIPLHSSQLPQPTDCVLDLEVDLRPIEGGLALHPLVNDAARIQRLSQSRFRFYPVFFRAQVVLCRVASLHRQL